MPPGPPLPYPPVGLCVHQGFQVIMPPPFWPPSPSLCSTPTGLRAHQGFQKVIVPCYQKCVGSEAVRKQCLAECYPRAMATDKAVGELSRPGS